MPSIVGMPGDDEAPWPKRADRMPPPRPRVADDEGLLGLSRRSRGRLGSRLFTWFFVFVYGLILVQLIVSLLRP